MTRQVGSDLVNMLYTVSLESYCLHDNHANTGAVLVHLLHLVWVAFSAMSKQLDSLFYTSHQVHSYSSILENATHCGASLSEELKSVVGFLQLLKMVLFDFAKNAGIFTLSGLGNTILRKNFASAKFRGNASRLFRRNFRGF